MASESNLPLPAGTQVKLHRAVAGTYPKYNKKVAHSMEVGQVVSIKTSKVIDVQRTRASTGLLGSTVQEYEYVLEAKLPSKKYDEVKEDGETYDTKESRIPHKLLSELPTKKSPKKTGRQKNNYWKSKEIAYITDTYKFAVGRRNPEGFIILDLGDRVMIKSNGKTKSMGKELPGASGNSNTSVEERHLAQAHYGFCCIAVTGETIPNWTSEYYHRSEDFEVN